MQFSIVIPDAALNTFKPQELKEFIEVECDNVEAHIKRVTNMALKASGKPLMVEEPVIKEETDGASTQG